MLLERNGLCHHDWELQQLLQVSLGLNQSQSQNSTVSCPQNVRQKHKKGGDSRGVPGSCKTKDNAQTSEGKVGLVSQAQGLVIMVSVIRCVLVERGKKMKSQLTVLTSIRRSFILPGILRRTSSLWLPQTICSCSRRTTNNIHIASFFTTPQFHTVLSGGETPKIQDFNKPQTPGNFSDFAT